MVVIVRFDVMAADCRSLFGTASRGGAALPFRYLERFFEDGMGKERGRACLNFSPEGVRKIVQPWHHVSLWPGSEHQS